MRSQAVALARLGAISVETREYALEDGPQAFADLEAGKVPGRAVLVP